MSWIHASLLPAQMQRFLEQQFAAKGIPKHEVYTSRFDADIGRAAAKTGDPEKLSYAEARSAVASYVKKREFADELHKISKDVGTFIMERFKNDRFARLSDIGISAGGVPIRHFHAKVDVTGATYHKKGTYDTRTGRIEITESFYRSHPPQPPLRP